MQHGSLLSVVIRRSVVRVQLRQTAGRLRKIHSRVIGVYNAANVVFGSEGSGDHGSKEKYFLGVSFNTLMS